MNRNALKASLKAALVRAKARHDRLNRQGRTCENLETARKKARRVCDLKGSATNEQVRDALNALNACMNSPEMENPLRKAN